MVYVVADGAASGLDLEVLVLQQVEEVRGFVLHQDVFVSVGDVELEAAFEGRELFLEQLFELAEVQLVVEVEQRRFLELGVDEDGDGLGC